MKSKGERSELLYLTTRSLCKWRSVFDSRLCIRRFSGNLRKEHLRLRKFITNLISLWLPFLVLFIHYCKDDHSKDYNEIKRFDNIAWHFTLLNRVRRAYLLLNHLVQLWIMPWRVAYLIHYTVHNVVFCHFLYLLDCYHFLQSFH